MCTKGITKTLFPAFMAFAYLFLIMSPWELANIFVIELSCFGKGSAIISLFFKKESFALI